jgi:bla regulator protein blaR1
MRHLTLLVLLAVLVITPRPVVVAQSPSGAAPRAAFDVATVKPNKSGDMRVSMRLIPGGAYEAFNVTLGAMIRLAYRLQDFQIVGAPAWVDQDRFDIVGKPPAGEPLDLQPRMQSLLAERFNLKSHEETREFPIYALVVNQNGKLGAKLTPSSVDCAAMNKGRGNAPTPMTMQPGVRPQCGIMNGPGKVSGGSVTMAQLANTLSQFSGRMVLDRTGLSGAFDFDLEFTPDPGLRGRGAGGGLPPSAPAPGSDRVADPAGISVFTAVQEQLGLKLDSQRGPVPVLVIDSVSQPTEN